MKINKNKQLNIINDLKSKINKEKHIQSYLESDKLTTNTENDMIKSQNDLESFINILKEIQQENV